jgi:hypothetical protein
MKPQTAFTFLAPPVLFLGLAALTHGVIRFVFVWLAAGFLFAVLWGKFVSVGRGDR